MKILVVLGTRPEAVKMAPVIRALRGRPAACVTRICVTAQHRELLDGALAAFDLAADFDLDIMRPDQSISGITGAVLLGMERVIDEAEPDLVLVHGDTTTSFAAALAAHYRQIPAGHVEAGLRTHNRHQPFPEELNRRMTDDLCTHHFAPTERARENLLREAIDPAGILVTGNTAVDALLCAAALPNTFADPALESLGIGRDLILVTAHRRESFGKPFAEICRALRSIAAAHKDVDIVYPVHPNPNVRRAAREFLAGHERIHLIEPMDYVPFVHLMKRARLIITDSGGIQEEAPSLGVPVLVLRAITERPEAVEAGFARLVGTEHDAIVAGAHGLLSAPPPRGATSPPPNPYGDGRAGERIADYLLNLPGEAP